MNYIRKRQNYINLTSALFLDLDLIQLKHLMATKIIFIVFLILSLNTGCSSHCDDEDYTRDETEAAIQKPDSITTSVPLD